MINIFGIVIIGGGFLFPYLTDLRIPSTLLFWVGGLLTLNKGIIIRGKMKWAKWAQIGILVNIAVVLVMILAHFLIGYGEITTFEYWISRGLYWLSSPAAAVGQQIFPYPETHHPDGSISFQMSFMRSVVTEFMNVAIFALSLACIGMFWQRRKHEDQDSEHGNRGDSD